MKRTERIKFWLDDDELALVDKKAKAAGLNRSAYIRKLINEAEVIPATDIDYALYSAEFRRLGKNLNQHLKRMNTTGEVNCAGIDMIMSEIKKATDLLLQDLRTHTTHLKTEVMGVANE